ncbi:ABC transporter ATP-binding protein [Agromyces atrinae]|uniref:ABC transporter ATP-binding protein n=1 Tax=Agromyces atrinae TaxID=592376 RepID=A0A4Q2M534_9MICO|nr:ABC transporter ATP-binding protein [Agromyces atrinae]NYD68492.1 ABC-2 type transport system ATP-binding protein [Agromyces atrinae]RXZ84961.1 ABC transporter ATP-binding protein [Agromyces atrinae]
MTAIELRGATKRYRSRTAIDDVGLTVEYGEIVGLLGRNGAGKSTTVAAIAGLIGLDDGEVRVDGFDPVRDRRRVRAVLGVQLQDAELHAALTVGELARLYRSFYRDGLDPDALLERVGLTAERKTRFENLSGGQQQRLSIALALIGDPRVVVLDELTTGLDPEARRSMWSLVRALRADGLAVLLVSHLMEEVERLCDRVVVLDAGRVIARGTPAELVSRTGGETLDDAFLALTGEKGEPS